MNNSAHVAELVIRSTDMLTTALSYGNLADKIELITISFKDLSSLYAFVRGMKAGVRDTYNPPLNHPGDFRRDEVGFIYSDWTLLGVNYRLTTRERTTGYPIYYIDGLPPLSAKGEEHVTFQTVTYDPATHVVIKRDDIVEEDPYGVAEERKRHP